MKYYISLIICFISVVLFGSCSDWLDVKSTTQVDREKLFTTESGYSEALIGVYSKMCGSSLYGCHLSFGLIEALGGAYADMGTNSLNVITLYPYKSDDPMRSGTIVGYIDAIWKNMYNVIANLNSILSSIDDNKNLFTGDNYELIKGEALGLHAFIHFELLRMYGEAYTVGSDKAAIPFETELSTDVAPMKSVDEALTLIITELEEAVLLLEKDPIRLGISPSPVLASLPSGVPETLENNNITPWFNRRFHFNYYAAKATLARAYLWKGDAQSKNNALQAALDVIKDQETRFPWALTENVTSIGSSTSTTQDRTFATEHIFALNMINLEDRIDGYFLSKNTSGYLFRSNVDFFEGTADPRRTYLYSLISGNNVLSKYYQRVVPDVSIQGFFINRIPLIRVSEMYYIAAECSPDPAKGLEYLETVRTQRRLADVPITDLSAVQDEICKEYRKEFCGEGQLWFYYKRHGFTEIPNMPKFGGIDLYTFDRPEDEDFYGNRK